MLIIAGLVAIFAAVLGGFVLERGNVLVLVQPAELLIIGGSAAGILLVSNPPRTLSAMRRAVMKLFHPAPYTPAFYLATLKLLHDVFAVHRRLGNAEFEKQMGRPQESAVFQPYGEFLRDSAAVALLCDSFRIAIAAGVEARELEQIMRLDIDAQRRENDRPANALGSLADALPGLGIVAAVLGVVVTMQALGGPAAEIGSKVAAALVGTFLGILMCYGVANPLAAHLEARNEARLEYLQVIRTATVSSMGGASPLVAAEFARRSIGAELRPSFDEMENALRRGGQRLEPAA